MTWTAIDLDDGLVRQAADILGTGGEPGRTVHQALWQVVDEWRRSQAVDSFRALDFDLCPETLSDAWR
ncbi:hypothetical protein [Saccharomonospora iraqiensis]|uniref:hypothetical protein n=1 Tax=Saccharomonospora iraqiensis TaxID=52698 RepID=UPI00022E7554|nr:hypothetical protein [Saccharomonospora iraqiensis]